MKVLIIGYSQCGKSTAAETIANLMNGKFCNESDYIIIDYAISHGLDPAHVRSNKYLLRDELYKFARAKQAEDPTYPVKLAFEDGATVITGTRNPDELAAKRDLYDLILWVDRPGWQPGSTDKLSPSDADEYIMANSVEELQQKVTELIHNRFGC